MTFQRSWREAAMVLLAAVVLASLGSIVLDGGRAAFAADDCQYGQYGQYGECKAQPTVRPLGPTATQIGFNYFPQAVLEGGASPTGQLTFRFYRPADTTCGSAAFTGSTTVNGNGVYQLGPFSPLPLLDQIGAWRLTVSYGGDARNASAATPCGAFQIDVARRQSSVFLSRPFSVIRRPVDAAACRTWR